MVNIWALTDHRPGTANQVLGVAHRMPHIVTEQKLHYSRLSKLPNGILGVLGLAGLTRVSRTHISPPWPDIVIAAGRRAAPVGAYIKRKSPKTVVVHLMHPWLPLERFDLVILPAHDHVAPRSNILTTLGAPHTLTEETLFSARARMPLNPDLLPKPWTLLCLGGNTSHGSFLLTDVERLVAELQPIAKDGGAILMTSSRRTPPALASAAVDAITATYPELTLSFYSPEYPEENPYHAWLSQADRIIVTADSVSMISEAAFTTVPLYTFAPQKAAASKHLRFVEELIREGYAKPLESYDPLWASSPRLDESKRVADAIEKLRRTMEYKT